MDVILCGHIHEARGVEHRTGTLIVNPGPLYMGMGAVVDFERCEAELLEV